MKTPAKILFDANSLAVRRTGVGQYTARLVESLAATHPDTHFIGYYYNFLGRKPAVTSPKLPNLKYRPVLWMPGALVNLLRRLHIPPPVELLTFTRADFILYPNYLGLPSLFGTPSSCVIHDLTFIDLPDYVAKKNLHDLLRYVPGQIKRSKFVITVSRFSKKRISEHFGIRQADILVTPIPPETPQKTSAKQIKVALDKFGISGKYILTLGTIEPRKNLPNLVDAYLQLPASMQAEYALVVVGKVGWNCRREIALLDKMRREGKNIQHIGYVSNEDRELLYRGATVFTTASWYEGFGMPALEAMIVGTPCAISNIEIFKEVTGEAVLYFNQGDPGSISAALQQLLTDTKLREQLSAKGLIQARRLKWSDIARNVQNRINATLSGGQS